MSLPPIGAKIRVTSTHTDGTTVTIEGIVTAHPSRGPGDWVEVGTPGVCAYVRPSADDARQGATVAVDVLELPKVLAKEPPSGGAAATEHTVWLHAHGGWFDGFTYSLDAPEFLTWAQLNERHPDVRVLVHDPAATASELPARFGDADGDRFEIFRISDGRLSVRCTGSRPSTAATVYLNHDQAYRAGLALLAAGAPEAGER